MANNTPRQDALDVLGVTEDDLEDVPQITPTLRAVGGKPKWRELLAASVEPDAKKLLKLIRKFPAQWEVLPIEAFCVAAGLETKKVFGLIAAELMDQSKQESILKAAASQGAVVDAVISRAKGDKGTADAKLLLQHTEFLPQSKAPVFVSARNFVAGTQNVGSVVIETGTLPPAEQFTRILQERANAEILQIEGGPPQTEPLPGDLEGEDVIDIDPEEDEDEV